MNKRIGNVGVLNLLNATEESVKSAGTIGNIGAVLYRAGQGHLLTALSAGNVGSTVEVPEGYSHYNGLLEIDRNYLESLNKPLKMVVNGAVLIKKDVTEALLAKEELQLIINGALYAPDTLKGAASQRFPGGTREVKGYSGNLRFENGQLTVTNSFLAAAEEPLHLAVNGMLELEKDLDIELLREKIAKAEVNGLIRLYEDQEAALNKKLSVQGSMEIIPSGYEWLKKARRLNARSIRPLKGKKVYTKNPILFESDVAREDLETIEKIQSASYIVCSEELEDLMYERLGNLETEVLAYADDFIFIEGEQVWNEAQLEAIGRPAAIIVEGKLKLAEDVKPESVKEKVASLDLFGEIQSDSAEVRAAMQAKLRVNEGLVSEMREAEENNLQNIGELSL
ncbi:hypothetical protein [Indiicoccus explosivorum]|uniref:hypothetical protein n=1 Tax=Indiicoccus explosivorum TaxID=1917864 RepID=UPI000B4422FB|nr:hypothetical protein [Indiicoccus explosivorum]